MYTYQLDKQQLNPESDKFFDKGNIVQQLGLIAGQLLTEEKWDQADIKLENANVAENIAKKVIDRSNDMPLTTLLREMLSSNPFTIPQLSEVASFMKARAE